jgi:hypothetical protein
LKQKWAVTTSLLLLPFFSSVGVVAKKAIAIVITFFKCFVVKKAMAC